MKKNKVFCSCIPPYRCKLMGAGRTHGEKTTSWFPFRSPSNWCHQWKPLPIWKRLEEAKCQRVSQSQRETFWSQCFLPLMVSPALTRRFCLAIGHSCLFTSFQERFARFADWEIWADHTPLRFPCEAFRFRSRTLSLSWLFDFRLCNKGKGIPSPRRLITGRCWRFCLGGRRFFLTYLRRHLALMVRTGVATNNLPLDV